MKTFRETFRGLTLDPFQQKAIKYIDQNKSVLVAAPTGVGKTLIADYVIDKIHSENGRVIYTAPIKALSNQKFKEFKKFMGADAVGILTGDIVLNPEASVLIMTTEIFRNMLQQSNEKVADVRYVIFDEIHYIDDPQRGSVWEESIIFMPPEMRFLGLSATIPNVEELAHWIESIQGQKIEIVTHFERVVPLKHQVFERNIGMTTLKNFKKRYKRLLSEERQAIASTSHLDLIKELKDGYLPCLFFCFSRKKCEINAHELAIHYDFLTQEQKEQVKQVINEIADRYPQINSSRWEDLKRLVLRGIGYHHAGMLPVLKDLVEELFDKRLLSVLYCTETFAVGLNFPCRTVCFESSTKWDGFNFRPVSNREYFQMAGRAGRRGIDEQGFVFTLIDINYFEPHEFPSMREGDIEPLKSQFALTYNSILNLINNYSDQDIYRILGMNFATYQAVQEKDLVQEEIEAIELELEGFCPHTNTDNCPAVYNKLLRKRKKIEKDLHRAQGRRRNGLLAQKANLDRRISQAVVHDCDKDEQKSCFNRGHAFNRLQKKLARLNKRFKQIDPQQRFLQEFRDKKELLKALGYVQNDKLTTAGIFASQIHVQELLVTELFMEGILHRYTASELNAMAVAIGYEPRKGEFRLKHNLDFSPIQRIAYHLIAMEEHFLGFTTTEFHDHIALLAYKWSQGESFSDIMSEALIDEGDVIFAFRRGIDLLRQIRNATVEDKFLNAKLREAITKMDRDEVSIWL
ncbi:MAG: DEAD/DEAH box helicase [Firmicutes bacterium]|nr:DEAD/DEAH box helicase [Bacillota bacterium]